MLSWFSLFHKWLCLRILNIIIGHHVGHAQKGLWPQSGEFYTKIGTFPTFYKEIFLPFYSKATVPKANFFPRSNSKIYLYHSVIFLVSTFYFGVFLKLRVVSPIFLLLFYKRKLVSCFSGVNLCWKKSQVSLKGVEPCQTPIILGPRM